MTYERDYETKGKPLIKLGGYTGVVNATTENFNQTTEEIMKDETFIDRHDVESGVFCLVEEELDIPF